MAGSCQKRLSLRRARRATLPRGHADKKEKKKDVNAGVDWAEWVFQTPEGLSVLLSFFHFSDMIFFLYPLPSLMACEPCCGVLYRVSSWGGLDAESAFKPCIPLHLTTSSFVCVLERGGLGVYPLASLSTMLLKRDTWLPNVSSRREPCFHLCPRLSFFFFFLCVCVCAIAVRKQCVSDCDEKPEAIPL